MTGRVYCYRTLAWSGVFWLLGLLVGYALAVMVV